MTTTIRTLADRGAEVLKENSNIRDPYQESELLLGAILNLSREYIMSHPEHEVSEITVDRFTEMARERGKGKPIAYITGQKEFYDLRFFITPDVMIPRPETELLVDEVIKDYREIDKEQDLFIADVGTGSGCIAVALARNLLRARLSAVDISEAATKVAFRNFIANETEFRIELLTGDLLDPVPNLLDIVVANLPYLPEGAEISPEVQFEPNVALYSGKDGLDHINRLIARLSDHLQQNGRAYLEIHPPQIDGIRKIISKHLPKAMLEFKKDLAGRDRIAKISL